MNPISVGIPIPMHTFVVDFPGFLSTGDSNAPGNYALLDQVAALHWIQENIRPFGGNPSDVTLLGHGLGAALVNLLMTSPVTSGQLSDISFLDAVLK